MSLCPECDERTRRMQEAFLEGHIARAVVEAGLGLAEMLGLKDKLDVSGVREPDSSTDGEGGGGHATGLPDGGDPAGAGNGEATGGRVGQPWGTGDAATQDGEPDAEPAGGDKRHAKGKT